MKGSPKLFWRGCWLSLRHEDSHALARNSCAILLPINATEHKRVIEQQRLTPAFQQALLDTSLDGILVVSEKRDWLSFNRRFTEMWGLPNGIVKQGSSAAALASIRDKLVDPEGFMVTTDTGESGFTVILPNV